MDYSKMIVMITAGSSDIGKELAFNFARCQAKIIMTYHNHYDKVLEVADEIKDKYHQDVDIYHLDLCKEECIEEVYNNVKKKYGKIDILINVAALSLDEYYLDKKKDEFMKVLETNVVGTFLVTKYFMSLMHNGYIFNISSTDGIDTGNVYSIDYNVSKAGINMLTKTMALDNNNTIISLCPNWVDTSSTREMDQDYLSSELKRIGQKKLIKPYDIFVKIKECIDHNVESGSIIRIDGDENE